MSGALLQSIDLDPKISSELRPWMLAAAGEIPRFVRAAIERRMREIIISSPEAHRLGLLMDQLDEQERGAA